MDAGSGSLASILRAFRERAGLTQEELAERAGLTRHAISALERGTRTRPYPHTVRSLAAALDLSAPEQAAMHSAARAPADLGPTPAPGLTVPPTTLYGRDADIDRIAGRVGDGARLVTLTGPGGVGKTRLLVAAAARLAEAVDGHVVHVPLAALTEARAVASALARALGITAGEAVDVEATVRDRVRGQRMLLVLDNFEHVLRAATLVAGLVAAAPQLVVLVSSRAALRVRGEVEYAVQPLRLPQRSADTLSAVESSPAGALLLDRARSHSAGGLDDGAARELAALCHRLAGLPLAIELASAHLRVLSSQVLLDRLPEVSDHAGSRDLPERQRTMRATLDWSYGLLPAGDQRLFRLLGVFRGGATLEAIEALAGASSADGGAPAVAALGELVAHSLVVVRDGPGSTRRYTLLEPVAEYARSLLVGAEYVAAVTAHGDCYRALAERAAVGYERADQVRWLAEVEADEANVLLAIDRGIELGSAESVTTAARITWAMWLYWWLRGQPASGRRRAERCLQAPLPADLVSRVHLAAATMCYAGGDSAAAAAHWDRALHCGREQYDSEVVCKAVAGTGLAALAAGNLDVAAERFTASLAEGVRAGEDGVWMRSLAHVWLGTVHLLRGEAEAAAAEIQRGLALARSRGDRLSTYVALYNLAQAALAGGRHDDERGHLEQGIALSEQTGDRSNLAYFLEALAVAEARTDAHARVVQLLAAAQALRDEVGADVYAYYLPDDAARADADAAARAALGTARYADLAARAGSWDLPTAVAFALGSAARRGVRGHDPE